MLAAREVADFAFADDVLTNLSQSLVGFGSDW